MKHVLLVGEDLARGGGVFSSDRRTMVAAEARAEVQGEAPVQGEAAAAEFVKLDIISICKELLWKGLKDLCDYYISDEEKRCIL